MARWNHFVEQKYKSILFSSLNVGDKFRRDFGQTRPIKYRRDIVCVKTGTLTYVEKRSKKEHSFRPDADLTRIEVSHYSETNILPHT